jgi:hypothetical protein
LYATRSKERADFSFPGMEGRMVGIGFEVRSKFVTKSFRALHAGLSYMTLSRVPD